MTSQKSINIKGDLFELNEPKVMGILNVTPDSFYAKSRVQSVAEILDRARNMINDGADLLDIGGYSSRPGAEDIDERTEIDRVQEVIRQISAEIPDAIISIDTFRSKVAETALDAGAAIVNDISGGQLDDRMLDFVSDSKVPYIAMHMRGTPQTMKELTEYDDLVLEIIKYFSSIAERLTGQGHHDLIIDPGFGFAKNLDQNYFLLNQLERLRVLEKPMLVGVSRKSMIFKFLDILPENALNGTSVLNTLALSKGASILRVHDVKEAVETVKLIQKTLN